MKKFASILVIILCFALMSTSCGNADFNYETTTLTYSEPTSVTAQPIRFYSLEEAVGFIRSDDSSELNEKFISIYERNIVYIPERLACIKERLYIDELREILLRWESVIAFKRIQEAKYKKVLDKNFLKAPEMNLAEYALWRAYVCVKNNDYQMAKKCFMISEVIFPEIRSIGKFELTKQFLDGIDTKELDEIYMKDVIKC